MEARLPVTRYHPVLVAVHWMVALLVLAPLVFGARHLAPMSNADPAKLGGLLVHISVGALVGLLMLFRLVVRLATKRPAPASTGATWLDRIAWASHRILYLMIIAQAASGLWLAFQSDVFPSVFEARGNLPPDFWVFPARNVHYVVSRLVMALIALHVTGAAYHAFILRDGLLRRMWFGRRSA